MKSFYAFLFLIHLFVQPLFSQNTLDNTGLTSVTPSSVAFSLRKLSSSFSGPAIKVRRSADNAEAIVAFDGSGAVSASSLVTFTPGVIVGTALGTAQTGTIVSEVSKTGTITIAANKTGTITTLNTSATVTGAGTSFTTDLVAGDRLFNAANNLFLGVVASVTNNTTLLLDGYATASLNALNYKTTNAIVTGTGTNFTGELTTGDRLFNAASIYLGTVATITSATNLTLNAIDAVSVTAVPYKGTSAIITGTGTSFTGLAPGNLLISNNTTLGIISSIADATSLTLTTKAGGSVSGQPFKSTAGTVAFSTFYTASSVYVNTWYDQSGNNRNAIQLKSGNQPRIVNSGTLYTMGGRTSMEFSVSLAAFVETTTPASYLNNTLYTLNKVSAEATANPANQFALSTTGGTGPINTLSHFGYRSSALLTVAQLGHDQNFNATPGTTLESHTGVKTSTAASQFYKNGILLGSSATGIAANLSTVGLLHIGYYTPTGTYYNGSVSEVTIFPSALGATDANLLDNSQLAYYSIATSSWTGAISTDWSTPGNWSTGVVPTIASPSIAQIPGGMPRYPLINLLTVQANSISVDAGASLTVNGTGILQLAGTINNLGTCTASGGTIQYIGTTTQNIAANSFAGNAVQNLIINNSTGVSLSSNISVTGNLVFTTGNLNISTGILTIGGLVTNTVSGGLLGGANASLVVTSSLNPSLSFNQSSPGSTNSLKALTINSTGQANLINDLVINNGAVLTFTAGKLAIGNAALTIRGPVVNTAAGGLSGGSTSKIIVDGTSSPTLSFDQTTPGATNALSNLTLNCTGQTVTLNNNVVITSTLTLTAGTLADGGNQLSSTGTINIGAGAFKLGSSTVATTWPAFTTNTIAAGGTVEYAAGVAQTISSTPVYQNLTVSAAGGTTAANDLTVNGVLNLSAANPSTSTGSLSMSTFTLNMGPLATTIGQGDMTGIVKRTTILPNVGYTMGNEFSLITFPNTGTLPSQMSMKVSIGATPSWGPGAVKRFYDFIQTGGTGTKAVIVAHYLDAELNGNTESNLVDYSYRFTGPVLTEHGKSNFSTSQNSISLANVNVAFFSSTFGNVQLSFEPSTLTTLTWTGMTSTSWITATNWNPNGGPSTTTNLIIPDAATTPNSPSLPATASNGSVTIQTGGIVNADPGAQLTINNTGLAWSNNGTFNAGTSNVIFTNAGATINGVTNFNNVTIASGAALLMSTDGITRISGTMTNNGTWSTGLLENIVEYNGNNQTILIPNGSTGAYHNLIISGTGTSILPAASLNIDGDLTINGAISTAGNTINMNALNAQVINGMAPVTLNNLTINNTSSSVSLNQNLTIAGLLTVTAGKLAINGYTLTLSGNVVNTVPNGITGSTTSNLIMNGTVSPALSFDQTAPGISDALNNFSINSSGQTPSLATDLEVDGTMLFTAGKLAINGQTLTLKGIVTNATAGGLSGSSASNLVISGAAASPSLSFDQAATGVTNLLNNFTINSTGQLVTLANPLIVGGSLNLTDGIIRSTGINTLTLTAAASFTGGSNQSFIRGPLTRNTAGTAEVAFPIGKTNTYRPASVTPASAAAGVYSAEYFASAPPPGAMGIGVTGIAANEYWDIARTSGPDAQVTLLYTADNTWNAGSPASTDNIFVTHLNTGVWETEMQTFLPGNTGSGSNPVISMAMSSFSPFTFGFAPGVILPVTLIDFTGARMTDGIQLFWTTAREIDLASYQPERSADGNSFYTVGMVPAVNTSTVKTYNWMDHNPSPGVNFYRLKMIDLDGHFRYSNVLKLDMNVLTSISVYPTPITGNIIHLQMIGQPKGDYILNLYNVSGGKVMTSRITHDGNNGVRSIDLIKSIPKGVYYLQIAAPGMNTKICKILIQ